MDNIITYAKNIIFTFEELPFNEVDSLIFSWLSYLKFPDEFKELKTPKGIFIKDLFHKEYFEDMVKGIQAPEETLKLIKELSSSPRFKDVKMMCFSQELNKEKNIQFAAVTFRINSKLIYVAYRGTDSTFTGWKEDFELALEVPIPSQKRAVEYIEEIGKTFDDKIMVGGHSKGGNLAVYSSAKCNKDIQNRIQAIYSYDGPGFSAEELEFTGFKNIQNRIYKILPQSSLIGMFFEQESEYKIIRSNEIGIGQHNPFSWEIKGTNFYVKDELTTNARILYKGINSWILNLNVDERKKFINTIFEILEETGASSFDELGANFQKNIPIIAKKIMSLDKETRKFILCSLRDLATDSVKNVPDVLKDNK